MSEPLPRVFFFHMPKTGGSSLREAIRVGSHGQSVDRDFINIRAALGALPTACSVSGHLAVFPGEWPILRQHFITLTVLRDPTERLISQYFQIRRGAPHEREELVRGDRVIGLMEFLEAQRQQPHHDYRRLYVNWLSSLLDPCVGALPEDQLQNLAKAALAQFDIVGFTDRIDSVCDALRTILPGCPSETPRLNTSREHELAEITPAAIALARELTEGDRGIYDWARSHSPDGASFSLLPDARTRPVSNQRVRLPELDFGIRQAAIVDVHLDGRPGHEHPGLQCGEWCEIELSIDAIKALPDFTIGFGLRDQQEQIVFGTNSQLLGRRVDLPAGRSVWRFRIQVLLRPGAYQLDLSLHHGLSHRDSCQHWKQSATSISVNGFGAVNYFEGPSYLPTTLEAP